MKQYQVMTTNSKLTLGMFSGVTPRAALDVYACQQGYATYRMMCQEQGFEDEYKVADGFRIYI